MNKYDLIAYKRQLQALFVIQPTDTDIIILIDWFKFKLSKLKTFIPIKCSPLI